MWKNFSFIYRLFSGQSEGKLRAFSGQFQVGLKKIQELLLLFDFEPSILLEIDNDAIGNRPLAAGSENLAFREHYEIVPKEKLEVVNDNLLDLFFSIELGKISSKYLPFFRSISPFFV